MRTISQHLFGHRSFFSPRCSLFWRVPPPKTTDAGGLSSLFTRGDRAEVPLVGLRNDACGTSRRPGMMVAFVFFFLKGVPPKPVGGFFFVEKQGGIVLIDSSGSIIKHFFKGGPQKTHWWCQRYEQETELYSSHTTDSRSPSPPGMYTQNRSKQHMAKQRYEQAYANNCCTW